MTAVILYCCAYRVGVLRGLQSATTCVIKFTCVLNVHIIAVSVCVLEVTCKIDYVLEFQMQEEML